MCKSCFQIELDINKSKTTDHTYLLRNGHGPMAVRRPLEIEETFNKVHFGKML